VNGDEADDVSEDKLGLGDIEREGRGDDSLDGDGDES
jgi:hypothetical protein